MNEKDSDENDSDKNDKNNKMTKMTELMKIQMQSKLIRVVRRFEEARIRGHGGNMEDMFGTALTVLEQVVRGITDEEPEFIAKIANMLDTMVKTGMWEDEEIRKRMIETFGDEYVHEKDLPTMWEKMHVTTDEESDSSDDRYCDWK